MKKTRTRFFFERRQVTVVRRPPSVLEAFCETCSTRVRMMAPREAALCVGVETDAIYRQVAAKKIHFMETGEGLLFICRESLLGNFNTE